MNPPNYVYIEKQCALTRLEPGLHSNKKTKRVNWYLIPSTKGVQPYECQDATCVIYRSSATPPIPASRAASCDRCCNRHMFSTILLSGMPRELGSEVGTGWHISKNKNRIGGVILGKKKRFNSGGCNKLTENRFT